MSEENQNRSLHDLHGELQTIDHPEAQTLRERLHHYLENAHESDDIRDELLANLREFEIALEERQPGILRTLKAAIDTLANAGV